MNKALLAARQKFKGQKVVASTGGDFDNSPFTEGVHLFEVMDSKMVKKAVKGVDHQVWHRRLRCIEGTDKNKGAFPFPPKLDEVEGISSASGELRMILGDVVPGSPDNKGQFETDIGGFLEIAEDLIFKCIGQQVEATMKNQKSKADGSHINAETGEPYQNCFIRRGMGEDAIGTGSDDGNTAIDPKDDLNMGSKKKKPAAKKPAKKKAAKKKAPPKRKPRK